MFCVGNEPLQDARISPSLLKKPSPELLEGIDTLVLDCDGVIWQGEDLIEGSREALVKFR
jgi:hypothetical protein